MPKPRVDPLSWNAPIVDPETGFPTDFFMRQFSVHREFDGDIEALFAINFIAGAGLTGGGLLGDLLDITYALDTEFVQDLVGAMLSDGTTIDFTYNDGAGTITAELKDLAVSPAGTYGDGSHYAIVTVDAKGRVTSASQGDMPVPDSNVAHTNADNAFSEAQTIATTTQRALVVQYNDDGSGGGVTAFYVNSASPAVNDNIWTWRFQGNDSGGNLTTYSALGAVILDPTDGSEDSRLFFQTVVAGTLAARLRIEKGVYTTNATGGDKGADTINASHIYKDGTEIGVVYDLSLFFGGLQSNAELLFRMEAVRAFTLPSSLTGSRFKAVTAATASTTWTLKNNGSSIGTLVWAAAGTVPTVTFSSPVTFAVGDIFTIENQATADTTLKDVSANFKGTL